MISKPNIALIHYSYPPVVGGVESVIHTQAKFFNVNGYNTTVIVGDGANYDKNINFYLIPELKSLLNLNPKLKEDIYNQKNYPKDFFILVDKIVKRLDPILKNCQIVIAHNIFSLAFNPAIGYALLKIKSSHPEIQIISWTHDFELKDSTAERTKKYFANQQLEEYLYKRNKLLHYVAISHFLKNNTFVNMLHFDEKDITVIPNSIDIQSFMDFDSSTLELIKTYSLLEKSPLILLPSKILPHKNINLCIEIINELKKRCKKPLLIITAKYIPHDIISSKKYYDSVIETINKYKLNNNVLILPDVLEKINMRIIKNLYALTDLVIFLSNYENFGLPIIESGLMKTPVLCSSLTVFKELADRNAIYVDFNTPSPAIADRIIKYLTNNPSSVFFSKIKNTYDVNRIFYDKLIPFLTSLI